jgi:hypothetical protein
MAIATTQFDIADIPIGIEGDTSLTLTQFTRLKAAKISFFTFCKLIGKPTAGFHREWFRMHRRSPKVVLMAPRSFAKSTFTQLLSIYYMLFPEMFPRNKFSLGWIGQDLEHIKIVIVSYANNLSRKWLKEFKMLLKYTIKLLQVPMRLVIENANEITLSNGSQIVGLGIKDAARGARAHLLIVDDVQKDIMVKMEEIRELYEGVFLPFLHPYGYSFIVGTALTRHDFLHELFALERPDGSKAYLSKKYKAIQEDGTSLWEPVRPLEWLRETEAGMSRLRFAREYLNEPMSDDSAVFGHNMIQAALAHDCYLGQDTGKWCYMGIDLADGQTERSDYTAFVVIEVVKEKVEKLNYKYEVGYVRELELLHGKNYTDVELNNAIVRKVVSLASKHKIRKIYIEKNKVSRIVPILKDPRFVGGLKLPVEGIHTGTEKHDQEKGIPAMAARMEVGKLKLPYMHSDEAELWNKENKKDQIRTDTQEVINKLTAELQGWIFDEEAGKYVNNEKNDDRSMAMWKAMQAWDKYKVGGGMVIERVSF